MAYYFDFFQTNGARIVATLFIILVTYFLSRLVNRLFKQAISDINSPDRSHDSLILSLPIDSTQLHVANKIITSLIYFIGVCLAISRIPELQHAAYSLLAGSGIVAIILTFALREAFSNILAGLFIIIFEPFKIGSYIKIDSTSEGIVKDITLHHTIIQTPLDNNIIIPNSVISNKNIEKVKQNKDVTTSFDIYISYLADLKKAQHILGIIIDSHELLIDKRTQEQKINNSPIAKVNVENLTPYYIQLKVWICAKNDIDAYKIKCDTNFNVKEAFDKHNIPFVHNAYDMNRYNQVLTK